MSSPPSPPPLSLKLWLSLFETLSLLLTSSVMAVDPILSSPLGPAASEKDAKALQFIEEMTRNADSVQERVLAEILSRNGETEYLKRFKLEGSTVRETFKSKIPVIKYEDLQPEIQRIANGDRSAILSAHPISEFLTRWALTSRWLVRKEEIFLGKNRC